jgi:hypothetical protein
MLTRYVHAVAHASSESANPLVVVANDVTNQTGYRFEVFNANIDTAFASTTQVRCPAGTLITTKILPLSQASTLHEPYVVLPSSQTTASVREKAVQEIQRLLQAKGDSLHSKNSLDHPLTQCGHAGSASLYWADTPGDDFYSTITFYKSSDCTTVSFDTATIRTYTSIGRGDYWVEDLYGGQNYNVPDCPDIDSGTHSHGIGRNLYLDVSRFQLR